MTKVDETIMTGIEKVLENLPHDELDHIYQFVGKILRPEDTKRIKMCKFNHYFYYLRSYNKPVVTVCLIEGTHGISRGIAICSDRDSFVKKEGRKLAYDRAFSAYLARANNEILKHNKELIGVGKQEFINFSWYIEDPYTSINFKFKSDPDPNLYAYEKEILFKPEDSRRTK